MKTKILSIRYNVFETNSSSLHSYLIKEKDNGYLVFNDDDNEFLERKTIYDIDNPTKFYISFEPGEFHQDFEVIISWYEKLIYYIADTITQYNFEEKFAEINQVLAKHIDGCLGMAIYKDNETAPIIFNYDSFGSVDHQSSGGLQYFMQKYKVSLEDLVFNPKYIIVTDSDCCDSLSELKQAGILTPGTKIVTAFEMFDEYEEDNLSDE